MSPLPHLRVCLGQLLQAAQRQCPQSHSPLNSPPSHSRSSGVFCNVILVTFAGVIDIVNDGFILMPGSFCCKCIFQVNHEFQLFEARVSSLSSLVDVYLLLESNYSSYGSPKPLSFLTRLQGGWLAKHQANLLYILLPFFPKAGETNGWYADSFLRLYLGKAGMKLIDGLRDDDIFLLLDADELPTAEALLFLKLFDGWKEPVRFGFRWTVFGFFWLKAADPSWLESLPLVDQLVQLVGGQRWGPLSTS